MGLEMNRVLLAKTESSYGADPGGMGAGNAIRMSNLSVVTDPKELARANYKSTLSSDGIVIGGKVISVSFDLEMKGIGSVPTANTPLEYDALLKACAMTVDYSASWATYTPESTEGSLKSVYMKANYDGIQYAIAGAVGNFSFNAVAGEFVILSFNFMGLWVDPSAVAQLTPSFASSEIPPIFESAAFTIDTHSDIINALTMDMGNTISPRPDANSVDGIKGFRISNREVTGTLDPEQDFSNHNMFTKFKASTAVVLQANVGASAGNQFQLYYPTVQYRNVTPGAREGIDIYDVPYIAIGDDNEFRFRAY